MEIIAIADDRDYYKTYIVKISKDEMDKISGETRCEQIRGRNYKVGDDIPVSQWWKFITEILDKEANVRDLGKQLKTIGELVTGAWPSITNAISTTEKKEETHG